MHKLRAEGKLPDIDASLKSKIRSYQYAIDTLRLLAYRDANWQRRRSAFKPRQRAGRPRLTLSRLREVLADKLDVDS